MQFLLKKYFSLFYFAKDLITICFHDPHCEKMAHSDENSGRCCACYLTCLMNREGLLAWKW